MSGAQWLFKRTALCQADWLDLAVSSQTHVMDCCQQCCGVLVSVRSKAALWNSLACGCVLTPLIRVTMLLCSIQNSLLSQVRKLRRCITLEELKAHGDGALAGMPLLTRGRLSVQPVTAEQWAFILGLEDAAPE